MLYEPSEGNAAFCAKGETSANRLALRSNSRVRLAWLIKRLLCSYSKFFRVCSKNIHPGKLHCPFFVPEKLARLFVMREVKPSADRKMIKLVTVHNLFNYDNLANLKNLLFSENF